MQEQAATRVTSLGLPHIIGINVLSCFDGIGCIAAALQRCGIPVARYEACDTDSDDKQVHKIASHMNPATPAFAGISRTLPQDIDKITEQHIIDLGPLHLLAGGPPCKDLSKARMLPDRQGRKGKPGPGFRGPTGRLFLKFIEVVKWFRKHNPDGKFLVENVVFDHIPQDWDRACKELGEPLHIDALEFSYTRRNRAYWTNTTLTETWNTPLLGEDWHPGHCLDAGWTPVEEGTTITASWMGNPDNPTQDTTRPYYVRNRTGTRRCLRPHEAEKLMGMTEGGTAAPGVTAMDRLHGIGNGMDINCLCQVLQCLRTVSVPREELPVGAACTAPWVANIGEGAGKQPLEVVDIAPWLTQGACPDHTVEGDKILPAWREEWVHPRGKYLITEWGTGVDIRYEGPREGTKLCENNPSFWTWPDESAKIVNKEVSAGRWVGPFIVSPTDNFYQTPLAVVEETDKYRQITNAKMGAKVNDHIPDPVDPVHMPTHAEIQRRLRVMCGEQGTSELWMAKRDIRHAYRNLACRTQDWAMAGLKVGGAYYMDTALNFGTRSSPDKFLELSDTIEWVLQRWGVHSVHYIDDFIFMGTSKREVDEMVRRFDVVCAAFGVPVKEEKDVGPAQDLTILGVEYDLINGVVRMPQHQIDRIHTGCIRLLQEGMQVKEARSLLGVMAWAAQCMPVVTPFTTRLWAAVGNDIQDRTRVRVSHGLRRDLQWWTRAIEQGMGRDGKAVIPVKSQHGKMAAGDAGTEWGIGGHDTEWYYKAPLPKEVRSRAFRRKRASSKFLELYQMLVMARVMGPQWEGCHVTVRVDNAALVPLFRKARGKRQDETDMVREIILLQALQGWTWTVIWVPRDANEAADALSKDDMPRFWANVEGSRTELAVRACHLQLPWGDATMAGKGWGKEQKVHRAIFKHMSASPENTGGLWNMLDGQVRHLEKQLPQAGHTTGVNQYLKLLQRARQPLSVGFVEDPALMEENIKRFMVDCVLTYPFQDTATGKMVTKKPVAASTACRYADEVAAYWSTVTKDTHKVHLRPGVRLLKQYLRKSLPHQSKQKVGITAPLLRRMVRAIRTAQGKGSMEEALFLTMWAGLLRPGEAVVSQKYPQYDISRHPAVRDVKFYVGSIQQMPHREGRTPERMEICIKDSKTDAWRLTENMVVGATGDPDLCPVTAMWEWMKTRGRVAGEAPAFEHKRKAVNYATLRTVMAKALRNAGLNSSELKQYGGHSFRIGGAQALALAGKSTSYIMAMGRWKCIESVLTYVQTPTIVRMRDARAMVTALPGGTTAEKTMAAAVRSAKAVMAASAHQAAKRRSH